MTDGPTSVTTGDVTPTIGCDQCGQIVPALEFCVRCGDPLAAEKQAALVGRRGQFAAAPGERAVAVHLVSTLFPRLPRANMDAYRLSLLLGVAVVVALALLGLFPLALVAAELIVPLVMFLYLWDVDVYEDEPLPVVAFTAAWGILAGVVSGFAIRTLLPAGTGSAFALGSSTIALEGIALPIIGGALMLAGPLALLRHRSFNDVLDGATFGATSALAFTAAQGLVQAIDLLGGGIRPGGETLPWIVRLLSLGVATPLIAAGVIGAVAGAWWLRYRTSGADHNALGLVGRPPVATIAGAAILMAAALGQLALTFLPALIWLGFLAIISLLWLRAVIHLGLLEEAAERPIGPPIVCPNCGRMTPAHTFCGYCGVALRAAPKTTSRPAAPVMPTSDPSARS
ncbi:MAG TPA: hypothetical protein VNF73_17355 [Candidatus Saccharimonadales bacterium]|nr:hypothetical protein [Candidatus Saccharimonadales bacterium]